MTAISTAVTLDRVSAITGYEVKGSLEGITAGNLPQRVAILAESNTANQTGLPTSLSFTSAKEVGAIAGYGSPAYLIARILRPRSGDKLGGIPTVWYPISEAAGATATAITIGITGTASKNVTHFIKLSGRSSVDGDVYSFVVEVGDGAAEISQKMVDAVNSVLGAPASGAVVADDAVFTSLWKGLTSAEMNIEIDVDGDAGGITYAEDSKTAGAGLADTADGTANFSDEWNTLVINAVGPDAVTLSALEAFNGNINDKTGKYVSTVFKPAVYLFGNNALTTQSAISSLLDGRKLEMTNVFCPAPNSKAFSFEAAANVAFVYALIAQNTPHKDPLYEYYNDMPIGSDPGDFADSSKRDQIVKVGGSTVKVNSSKYQILDLVTTYHPDDEPQTAALFRWVRDLVGIDWNVKYKYTLLENIYVVGKTLIADNKLVGATETISAKRWKGIISKILSPSLQDEGISADSDYMNGTIQVQIGESNPNRFETTFKIKRTGVARVNSTTAETLFNFGG